MRWPIFVCLALGASCRPKAAAPIDAGERDASDRATARTKTTMLFARPISAVRNSAGATVIGRDRASGRLALAAIDGPTVDATVLSSAAGLDNPELVGVWPNLAVLADAPADAARRRVLVRIGLDADGGANASEPVPVGIAACSTADGVYSVARENDEWKGTFFPLTGGESEGPVLSGRAEATVVCGRRRAFVVLAGSGEIRAVRWSPNEHDAHPTLLPKVTLAEGAEQTLMSAAEDDLVVVKLEPSALHTLVWSGESGASWRKADVTSREGRALEGLEVDHERIGLLIVRTIAKAKGCQGSEPTDAVAEVAIADVASGKLVHPPEAVETWRCGAEPGPFFSGWARGKLIVAWPRGSDQACLRAGVRRGGLGYAEVDPAGGRAKIGKVARPAETIAEVGCSETQCYAVALTRGSDPCGAADGPESGRLELVAYPP